MGVFYTGKGDKGKSLICGKKVDKTCVEMEALGHLDEFNSLLGLVRNQDILPEAKAQLRTVQENLFTVQANIAIIMYGKKFKAPPFPSSKITELEKVIDALEATIQPAKKFVITGNTEGSAWLDYARAVCRRAERETIKLSKKKKVPLEIMAYLNRLSGLLFAYARLETKQANIKEHHPSYK